MLHQTEPQVLRQLTTGLGKSREMCLPQPSRKGRAPCTFLLSLSADQEPSSQRLTPQRRQHGVSEVSKGTGLFPKKSAAPLETRTHFTEVPAMSNGHSAHSSLGTEL